MHAPTVMPNAASPPSRSKRKAYAKLVLSVLLLAGFILGLRLLPIQEYMRTLLQWIDDLGVWGPAAYIGLYILACLLFVPGSIITLGAGVLFGVVHGSIYVSVASILGGTLAFLLGRYFLRNKIAAMTEKQDRFKAVDDAVGREGWKIVLLTRLSPIFPFNLLNYAFGLTNVSLKGYFFASWIGMLPGTVMYVYLGSLATSIASIGTGDQARTPAQWIIYVVGLVAAVAVSVYVTQIARKALAKRVSP